MTFAHLHLIMKKFLNYIFLSDNLNVRFRHAYFPFTKPSFEVDLECIGCFDKLKNYYCSICKGTKWIELAGAGMFVNEVLKLGGYNPEIYKSIAFGLGLERILMILMKLNDIRFFYYPLLIAYYK